MENQQLKQLLFDKYTYLLGWEEPYGFPTVIIPADKAKELVQSMYDDATLKFRFLTDLTAIHYPDKKGEELCVVYLLHNLEDNIRLRVKAYLPIDKPQIESFTSIYSGANWLERECYDFFGVMFLNHPNLTRIMNVDDMEHFPMRKEFPMEDPTRMDKDNAMFGRDATF